MKKLFGLILASLVVFGGCLTTDYNLRTVVDTGRYYQGTLADSTQTLMKWDTPEWRTKNVKYWRSAGVIVTNSYNAFTENGWLKQIVADGFEGTVYVEDKAIDYIQLAYILTPPWSTTTSFQKSTYEAKIRAFSVTNGSVMAYPALNYPYMISNSSLPPYTSDAIYFVSPTGWNDTELKNRYVSALESAFTQASVAISDKDSHVKWGVLLNDYAMTTWDNIENSGAISTAFSVDNTRAWSSMSSVQKTAAIAPMQSAKLKMYHDAGIGVIVRGDRLTTELGSNTDLALDMIDGYLFEDVNPTNVATFETQLAALRSIKTVNTERDALLIIAGVKNDVYHSSSPTVYAQLIQRLVGDGVYFTPGANNELWNMPATNPGSWWIRGNEDKLWQPQAPTYVSASVGPRKVLGATEIIPYDTVSQSLGFGGGGWLESGDFHPTDPNKVMLGADVVSTYYSKDKGTTFKVITKGTNSREDSAHFYAAATLGVKNSAFSGFIQATNGGIYSFAIDAADTFKSMTPIDSPTGMYIAEVSMGLTNPWGYWVEPIPFSDLAKTQDEKYIVASAGKYRWEGDVLHGNQHYPLNYVTVNYANPVGRQGLWYYNYDEASGTRKWRPIETTYDAWNKDHGMYRSIDIAIAGTDTIIVAASSLAGPQMLNVKTKHWTDLGSFPFHTYNGSTVTPTWGIISTTDNNTQTVESIYLTNRMTAYVCVVNKDGAWAGKGGLYRMQNVMFPTAWEWVGDQTVMPFVKFNDLTHRPIDQFSNGNGMENESTFNYVNVAEGSTSQPDTVYVATRSGNSGLSRIIVPYGEGSSYNQKQTWEPKLWLYAYRYDIKRMPNASFPIDSYNDKMHWNGITFEPMINPKNGNEVILQDNVVLVHTIDGGNTWHNIEPTKPVSSDLTLNSNNGYIETCTNDIAVLSDGRLVVSNADIGLGISTSENNWTTFDNISSKVTVQSSFNKATCDNDLSGLITEYTNYGLSTASLDDDLISWSYETSSIHVEPNWNGTGRDALFFDTGKRVGNQGMSNIIMYHDSNGDGTWEATGITTKERNPTRYKYAYYNGIAWSRDGNNVSFYAPYKEAETSACTVPSSGVAWVNFGVHKWTFNSAVAAQGGDPWTMTTLNTFNDYAWGTGAYTTHVALNQPVGVRTAGPNATPQAQDIVYNSAQNKLYMAIGYYSTLGDGGPTGTGGVWEIDLDDETPTWVQILGLNSWLTAPADGRNYALDPMNLEISSDGSTLYVVNRGEEGGRAGVWKVTNLGLTVMNPAAPTHPTWNLPIIEWVLNNPSNLTAFVPMPPSRYGEILTDRQNLKNTTGLSVPLDYSFGSYGKGLLINPANPNQFWFSMWARNPANPDGGLWAFDTTRNILRHVIDQNSSDKAVYTDENLYYDTHHTPNRIVIGTDCVGVYYINYDGIFHTNKETTTKPLPISYVAHEYPPTGVHTINGDSKVTVVWNSISNYNKNGFTGYDVYRSDTLNGTYTKLTSLLTPTWSNTAPFKYDDTTAANGSTYYYKVGASYSSGIGGTDLSIACKGSPRQNYIVAQSTEDLWGHSTATPWIVDTGIVEDTTYNPFGGAYDATSAQGFFRGTSGQWYTAYTGAQTAQNKNWVIVSAYFKDSNTNGVPHIHDTTFRLYDQTHSATVGQTRWSWTSNPKVMTFTSTVGSGATQPDARGSYYVGNGWHRVWFKVDLNARSIKTVNYKIVITPYEDNAVTGYGVYMWGLMVEYSDTEPTTLCNYIPVKPIKTGAGAPDATSVPTPPQYWGDERCVNLTMTAPSTPTGLSITDYNSSSLILGWNASVGTSYYNVARSQTTGTEAQLTTSSTTSLTDPTVTMYQPYFYNVNAVNSDAAASAYSSEVNYYANEWTHTGDCLEGTNIVLNPPDFGSVAVAADSGAVDFSFVYDESNSTFHIIGIDGQFLNWQIFNHTTTPDATQFMHYTSTDLVTWHRQPNIPLYDATYAKTNVWAPHIIKYGSTWYMFYTGVDNTPPDDGAYHIERVMVTTSTNLYNWSAGQVVLEGDDFAVGITPFTKWNLTHNETWSNDCRDAFVVRNQANNGWTMYTGVKSQESVLSLADKKMMISLAKSLDADYGGNSALSLVGSYKQYDYLIQTRNSNTGYCESPQVIVEPNGYSYLFWTTNGAPGSCWIRTTNRDTGTLAGNTWGSVYGIGSGEKQYNRKAPEMLKLTTGEYISAYLESQTWDSEYFHIKFERIFVYPDGTIKKSNIVTPTCFGGASPFKTMIAGNFAVGPFIPVTNFTSDATTANYPLTVHFTDTSINTPTSWAWTFGDGGTSVSQSPTYTYTSAGTYTVALTSTNVAGSNTMTKVGHVIVTTPSAPPVASYTATPTTGNIPLSVTFTDATTNTPTSWMWYFGDGATSTTQNPTHIYSSVGIYSPVLMATNAAGTNVFGRTSYINSTSPTPVPTADFTGTPVNGTAPLTVNFTDGSTGASLTFGWTFGDGGTSTAKNPSYTYTVAGTYTVTLTVSNGGGSNMKTRTAYITVLPPAPSASFTGTPLTGAAPLSVTFTDGSTNSPTSWAWTFGDAGTSTTKNPSHTYLSAGTYTVALTATNAGGSNTSTRTGYVVVSPPIPSASFTGTPVTGTAPYTVTFTDATTNSPTSWAWTFGDGGTSTLQNPTHSYTVAGTYTVVLTATNASGNNSMTRTSYIYVASAGGLPSISGYTGTVIDGQTITINGSGFGTKPANGSSAPNTAAPIKWDSFEGVTPYVRLQTVKPEWRGYGSPSTGALITTVDKHSGTQSITDGPGVDGVNDGTNNYFISPVYCNEFYVTYWQKYANFDYASGDRHTAKPPRTGAWYGDASGYEGAYTGPGLLASGQVNLAGTGNDFNIGQVYCLTGGAINGTTGDGQWKTDQYYKNVKYPSDGWYRQESFHKINDVGQSNGQAWQSIILQAAVPGDFQNPSTVPDVTWLGFKNIVTRPAGYTWQKNSVLTGTEKFNKVGSWENYEDDFYIDNTQARIELGSASTFNLSFHREIQIPKTWTDGTITATVNTGSFTAGACWLYVIDANGVVSTGYPVTIPAENYYQKVVPVVGEP